MTREEAIDRLRNVAWLGSDKDRADTEEAVELAVESLEAWGEVIKFIIGRIDYWDVPCSGDEAIRKELALVMWEIHKKLKEVEE